MILKILLNYIIGYLRIEVTGYYIERFINLCNSNHILTWNLKKGKEANILLNIEIKKLKEVIKLAKKVQCKVKIKRKRGLPFILNKYRKRKVFVGTLIVIILLISVSSKFIWNIEIRQEEGENIENLAQDIEEAGLKIGQLKSKIDTKEIVNKIRLKRQDLAWIGIELKGTNAIVKTVKAIEKPEIIAQDEYSNIVSNKEGVITKINAQKGTAQVKVGDTITNGTILIGGWMEGKYTGVRYVHAEGEVEAKVWYTKNKTIKYNTTETQETGNEEKKFSIKFNNFEINFNKGVSKFKIYDTMVAEKKFQIFSNFYLPISIVKRTNKELKDVEKTYTPEEAKSLGIHELEEELENQIENKEAIVNKNINAYEKEDSVEIFVTYEVIEKIGINEKI